MRSFLRHNRKSFQIKGRHEGSIRTMRNCVPRTGLLFLLPQVPRRHGCRREDIAAAAWIGGGSGSAGRQLPALELPRAKGHQSSPREPMNTAVGWELRGISRRVGRLHRLRRRALVRCDREGACSQGEVGKRSTRVPLHLPFCSSWRHVTAIPSTSARHHTGSRLGTRRGPRSCGHKMRTRLLSRSL